MSKEGVRRKPCEGRYEQDVRRRHHVKKVPRREHTYYSTSSIASAFAITNFLPHLTLYELLTDASVAIPPIRAANAAREQSAFILGSTYEAVKAPRLSQIYL